MVLITGAGGMLGSYVKEQFFDEPVATLGLKENSDFRVDITAKSPDFRNLTFETVIHCAGTEDESSAYALNLDGTKKLLAALEKNPPRNLVYVSSFRVYSHDAGEGIKEDANTWATGKVGKSKALAEQYVKDWCDRHDVTLTVLRPARMFGNGVSGESLSLFNDALSGKYIHIRGNDAKVSVVTAYDVARGIKALYKTGGIYNVADNVNPRLIDMVEAMTANAGAKKRMTHLPIAWAEWLWRLARWIPSINRNLSPSVVEERMKTLTLDGSYFSDMAGIRYHDTIAVMERMDPDYPYSDKSVNKKTIHEA